MEAGVVAPGNIWTEADGTVDDGGLGLWRLGVNTAPRRQGSAGLDEVRVRWGLPRSVS